MGHDLDKVVHASDEIAAVVKRIPGAVDVVADPIRGKPYLEIRFDRERAARLGVSVGEANEVIEAALAGKPVTSATECRERHPVVVRYARDFHQDEESVRELLVPASASARGTLPAAVRQVQLAEIADVQMVEGPATIKGENGLPRNYVRLNVRDRVESSSGAISADSPADRPPEKGVHRFYATDEESVPKRLAAGNKLARTPCGLA